MASMRFFLALLLACCSTVAMAQSDEGFCRNGMFGEENSAFGLGLVAAPGRTHFVYDMQSCPNATDQCRLKSYLVSGQRVVTGRTHGSYICIYYPNKGGGTAGWVEAARIRPLRVELHPPVSAWVGQWSDEGDPFLRFYVRRGTLAVHAFAAWPSFDPPLKDFPGGPHTGEIDEPVRLSGNRAYASECGVTFILLGDLMVSADPKRQCGGTNVVFTAVY
jgi:hypothetical protein